MRWLNYQHLFYFWQVAHCHSVTLAARKLRLAQPTISAQLKSFEDTLGEKLFEREGRGLKLTEAGHLTFRYAEQIFSLGQELLEVIAGNSEGHLKELKIGIADVVPKSLAYRIISPIMGPHSEITVSCLEGKTERLLADLSIGEIDLVIADHPIPPNVKVKAFNHFVGECGISFLANRELARKLKPNFPLSLAGAPFIIPTPESAVRQELELWFEKIEIYPKVVGSFQDRALMKIAAREKQGIIPVPSVVEAEVRKDFHLELVGRTNEAKEQIYIITIERRLKNPLIIRLCSEGQRKVFA